MFVNQNNEVNIRFNDYQPLATTSEIESSVDPNEIENSLMDIEVKTEDLILYPKELGLRLTEKELLELEQSLIKDKTIPDMSYLYFDEELNIRQGVMWSEEDVQTAIQYLEDLKLDEPVIEPSEIGEIQSLKEFIEAEGSQTIGSSNVPESAAGPTFTPGFTEASHHTTGNII